MQMKFLSSKKYVKFQYYNKPTFINLWKRLTYVLLDILFNFKYKNNLISFYLKRWVLNHDVYCVYVYVNIITN